MKPFTTSLPNLDQLSLSEAPAFIEELARDTLVQNSTHTFGDQALLLSLHLARAYTTQHKLRSTELTLRDMRARLDTSSRQVQLRYLIEAARFFLAKGKRDEAQTLWTKAKKMCAHVHDEYAETELAKLITSISTLTPKTLKASPQLATIA